MDKRDKINVLMNFLILNFISVMTYEDERDKRNGDGYIWLNILILNFIGVVIYTIISIPSLVADGICFIQVING